MRVFLNFIKGLKLVSSRSGVRLIIFLFSFNLIFSLILAVPMYQSLQSSLGDSLVGEQMTQGFDYLWWEEFRDEAQGLEKSFVPDLIGKGSLLMNLEALIQAKFASMPPQVLIFGIVYLLIHTLFAGGILHIFQMPQLKFSLKSFFSGAGIYFPRFMGIMLVSWIFFFGLIGIVRNWCNNLLGGAAQEAFSEVLPFYLGLGLNTLILFLFLFLHMTFDYARIRTVVEDKKNIFKTVFSAFGFVFQNLGPVLGLYFLIFGLNVAVSLLYILVQGIIPQNGTPEILLIFIWQQLFIFIIIWLRCWLYSSQLELYKYLN